MRRSLAFVLAGGGSRGALQAGALRALLEAGIRPDLVVGTPVGAVNAVFFGPHGFTPEALDLLEATWFAAAKAELLPPNPAWITMRVVFNRIRFQPDHRLRDFFMAHGLTPDIHSEGMPFVLGVGRI